VEALSSLSKLSAESELSVGLAAIALVRKLLLEALERFLGHARRSSTRDFDGALTELLSGFCRDIREMWDDCTGSPFTL